MTLTQNEINTTIQPNTFAYELFYRTADDWKYEQMKVRWDYRDIGGKLHSGVSKNLDNAIKAAKKFGYKKGGLNDENTKIQ